MSKEFVVELTADIVREDIASEAEFFSLMSDSMYEDAIADKNTLYEKGAQFGDEGSLLSQVLMALIASGVAALVQQGVVLTRTALLDWLVRNKKRIERNLRTDSKKRALTILIKYLSK